MPNRHFGNLADVFKHLALCEVLGALRPAEYWESHAGAASYTENGNIPAERARGVHQFSKLAGEIQELQFSCYGKALATTSEGTTPPRIPGSPMLARLMLGDTIRRYLFCDTDADALQNVQQNLAASGGRGGRELQSDKLECVQDDGVSVLRGACMLLPEQWAPSTLAFIDPYDIVAVTSAEISPLQLACELANRSIVTLLFYTFADAPGRLARHQEILSTMEKTRLLNHGTWRFEGSMKLPPAENAATPWGFGLIAFGISADIAGKVDQRLRALEGAYSHAGAAAEAGNAGLWTYVRTAV